MTWTNQHSHAECAQADYFFDEFVTLSGLEPGLVHIRAVSYGHDPVAGAHTPKSGVAKIWKQ